MSRGRSLDLKDAASGAQIRGDLWLLLAVQGLPVPIVLCYLLFGSLPPVGVFGHFWLLGLNVFLVAVREALFCVSRSHLPTIQLGHRVISIPAAPE
jgi:dolichol-phosphate mannosyltransferase